jgi:hypothetical protein
MRLLSFLFLLIAGPTGAYAQPVDLPTPSDLFAEARMAIGLPENHADIGKIEAHAAVAVTDPAGDRRYDTIVVGAVKPNALGDARFTMITAKGSVTYGETDGAIWYEGTDGARRDLPPVMAMFVRGHQFHRRVLFPELELAEVEPEVKEDDFEGEPVFKVYGTTHAGAKLVYYFDQRRKHVVGMHLTVQEPEGPHAMEFTLRDWRSTAGQSLFRRMDVSDRGKLYVYRYGRILISP